MNKYLATVRDSKSACAEPYTEAKYYSGYCGGSAKWIVSQFQDISAHQLNQGTNWFRCHVLPWNWIAELGWNRQFNPAKLNFWFLLFVPSFKKEKKKCKKTCSREIKLTCLQDKCTWKYLSLNGFTRLAPRPVNKKIYNFCEILLRMWKKK